MRSVLVFACFLAGITGAKAQAPSDPAFTGALPPEAATRPPAQADAFAGALAAYRRGNIDLGDAIAAALPDRGARIALEWTALRLDSRRAGFQRIEAFLREHPDFPMADWLHRRGEDALPDARLEPAAVETYFAGGPPEMASGKLALAYAARAQNQDAAAIRLVRSAWRENRLPPDAMRRIERDFPEAIAAADSRARALRLILDDETREGLRFAEKAGPDTLALARALAAALDGNASADALLAKLPATVAADPTALLARAAVLRRKGKPEDAARLLSTSPTTPEALVDGDAWWAERRKLARDLLDADKPRLAYEVVTRPAAVSDAERVEAEFHAGWIALRFLGEPRSARRHFERAEDAAKTPLSLARASYWLGRAADAGGGGDGRAAYQRAAAYSTTYYGQLSAARLGRTDVALPERYATEQDIAAFAASDAGAAIRALLAAGAIDLAQPLVLDLARLTRDPARLDALGSMVAAYDQPRLLTLLGKLAMQRGLPLAQHAFPTFGVPRFVSTDGAADSPMVYAIARQESEFNPGAISHAGARGLMQMMPATARRTARSAGLPFDVARLTQDPAYNAQLGAAHLGELLREQRGSYILTFAAYNAGGRRVNEWIGAYGDPRKAGVDPIDWVERIPISETRNYVQRVMENLQVYRLRLNRAQALLIADDLVRSQR